MREQHTHNEKELLLRIAEGDRTAFELLYRRHRGKALAVILSFVKSYADAEDILQDIFVRLWVGRESLVNVEVFDAYLFITVRNAVGKKMRDKDRQQKVMSRYSFERLPVATEEEQVLAKDVEALVSEALQQLPEQQRRMYIMSRREGLTHEQIGAVLQLSSKTISNTITMVLNHIRTFLCQHGYVLGLAWCFFSAGGYIILKK